VDLRGSSSTANSKFPREISEYECGEEIDETIVWWGEKDKQTTPRACQAVSAYLDSPFSPGPASHPVMAQIKGLSAQDLPPGPIRDCYKEYSAIDEVDNHPGIIDLRQLDPDQLPHGVTIAQHLSSQELRLAFDDFIRGGHAPAEEDAPMTENIPVYRHNSISG
jgi:hypothetical protein